MPCGSVQFNLWLPVEAPGLYTLIEEVESLDSSTQGDVRPGWGAVYTLPNNDETRARKYIPPTGPLEVSPSLNVGPGGGKGLVGKVYIDTTDEVCTYQDALGPMIRLHMRTTSKGNPIGLPNCPKSTIEQAFTLEISTDKWRQVSPGVILGADANTKGLIIGMPDWVFLTFKFDGSDTRFQFKLPISDVINAADVNLGIQMDTQNRVCVTALPQKNGILSFIDNLTIGLFKAGIETAGCYAVGGVLGADVGDLISLGLKQTNSQLVSAPAQTWDALNAESSMMWGRYN